MSGVFNRGLCSAFMEDLQSGTSASVLEACRSAGLDVRLRDDYLNAYSEGRSVAKLAWRRKAVYFEVHRKYLPTDAFPGIDPVPRGDAYVALPVTPLFASLFCDGLGKVMRSAMAHVRVEERVEARFLRQNAGGQAHFCCVDRQVTVPEGDGSRVDVVGVLDGVLPSLVLVEVKRDLDNSIQKVPEQVAGYLEIFSPGGNGLRDDVARSLGRVATQLRQLGFMAPPPSSFESGMPVLGLVVLARYNPRSQLLARAHASAGSLAHPVWLWVAEDDEALQLPLQEEWTRMGVAAP